MRRSDFISLFCGVAAWPIAADAQQSTMQVIGNLAVTGMSSLLPAFQQGLGEMGYVEGRNVTIERHLVQGQYDRLPALAAELVRGQVAVIAAESPVAALAAKAATTTIPIVFSVGSDPVKDGIVASLARPSGNITGVTFFTNLLSSKRLQLLHELVPGAATIGLLLNPNNANAELELNEARSATQALGLSLVVGRASNEREIDSAITSLARQGAAALYISGDAYLGSRYEQIISLAARHKLPISSGTRDYAAAGMLMSYGADRRDSARQFGLYVGRVLKGEKPADLPVMLPTKFEFVINLKTAKALGITVPNAIQLLADDVIE